MWPSLGKRTIVVWVFLCYQSFLMSSLHYAWNDHNNHLSIKTNHISLRYVGSCLVTRQMFRSTCLTKHGRLFTRSLTSFICFTPSLVVKGLPIWDFSCETCFVRWFNWQFGTEFLCLVKLTFRFAAVCLAYKWTRPHLIEFQCTENKVLSKTLDYKPRPPLGFKAHWTLALICVKHRSAYSQIITVGKSINHSLCSTLHFIRKGNWSTCKLLWHYKIF